MVGCRNLTKYETNTISLLQSVTLATSSLLNVVIFVVLTSLVYNQLQQSFVLLIAPAEKLDTLVNLYLCLVSVLERFKCLKSHQMVSQCKQNKSSFVLNSKYRTFATSHESLYGFQFCTQ